ncbi:MAG TPA: hypothetical protein VMU49_00250 [Candidatus Acidoferrales bacterium]|nr:hypothetical protein [Candidatus Acidoferrales bacterium]
MGKRRQQMRQVRPKQAQAPQPAVGDSKRQRARYVASGGILQGYSPEFVVRLGYIGGAVSLACLVILAVLVAVHPWGWPVGIVAGMVWLLPIAFVASFVLPGYRLARADRRGEPRMVQGQLVGASSLSTSIGLGMLMVRTRGGQEQYLVESSKLAKVPGNQVTVMLTVTPALRHVRSLGVMGQRLAPRPEPAVPDVVRRLRWLPLITPIGLCVAAIIGVDVVAMLPILTSSAGLHALLAAVAGALLGGAVFGSSYLYQRAMQSRVAALMPGAAG